MNAVAERMTEDILALPPRIRREVFYKLADSLPNEARHLAESSKRAEQMRSGSVTPMSQTDLTAKVQNLRNSLSKKSV